jgi:hypothetical protein
MVTRMAAAVTGRDIEVVGSPEEADLSLVYVYALRKAYGKLKRRRFGPHTYTLEHILEKLPVAERVLVVATENLDHRDWAEIGSIIRASSVPRLTFYPEEVDPGGARFPYWWNYLDWPQFPRPNLEYQRFGRLYSLDNLMSPLAGRDNFEAREERAVYISSHRSGIRAPVLDVLESQITVDYFGKVGERFDGPKLPVMERYRFAVATENSWGMGYDSEKIPEAWEAGCLPVGTFAQLFSDFRRTGFSPDEAVALSRYPLLQKEPDPSRVLNYLANNI